MCNCVRKGDRSLIKHPYHASTDLKHELWALHLQCDTWTACLPQTPLSPESRSAIVLNRALKIAWDVCTILLSLTAGVYTTHAGMRDKCFPHLLNNKCASKTVLPLFFGCIPGNFLVTFLDLWYVADIIFNFLLEEKKISEKNTESSYLTTWFLVDVISMLSWEVIFVQPVFDQKKSVVHKAVGFCKMIPILKKRWPQLIKICLAVKTARVRISGICCLIRFAPRYIVFTVKMKVVLLLRTMRHFRLQRRLFRNLKSLFYLMKASTSKVAATHASWWIWKA